MTTMTVDNSLALPEGYWTRNRKAGLILILLGLIAAVWLTAVVPNEGAKFFLGETTAGDPSFTLPGKVGTLVFGLLTIACGALLITLNSRFGLLVGLGLLFFVLA